MRYQEGDWAFEVTEEVGHVIVQPCVFVRARAHARTLLLQACVCGCTCPALQKLLSGVT